MCGRSRYIHCSDLRSICTKRWGGNNKELRKDGRNHIIRSGSSDLDVDISDRDRDPFRINRREFVQVVRAVQGIPNQGVITKRLKQVVLQGDKIVFVYNSRIRKYDIADGSLVYNKARNRNKPEEEFIGDDLTQKFQRIYKNGFYQ